MSAIESRPIGTRRRRTGIGMKTSCRQGRMSLRQADADGSADFGRVLRSEGTRFPHLDERSPSIQSLRTTYTTARTGCEVVLLARHASNPAGAPTVIRGAPRAGSLPVISRHARRREMRRVRSSALLEWARYPHQPSPASACGCSCCDCRLQTNAYPDDTSGGSAIGATPPV